MMKQKIKSYNFWISLTSVLILFIRIVGEKFGFVISENDFMDIMVVLCTVFAVLGIFDTPKGVSLTLNKESNGVTNVDENVLKSIDIYREIKDDINQMLTQLQDVIKTQNVPLRNEIVDNLSEKSENNCVPESSCGITSNENRVDCNIDNVLLVNENDMTKNDKTDELKESEIVNVDNSINGPIDVI